MEENNTTKQSDKFPCPGCGNVMHFDPGNGMLKCDYCDSTINFERKEGEIEEYSILDAPDEDAKNEDWSKTAYSIECEGCGAKTVISDETMSKFCAFCGSAHVIQRGEITGISPESVIPFQITDKQAKETYKKWISKRLFAPRALKTKHIAGKYQGTYIPYWTYDTDAYYAYTAQAGDYYYVTETRRNSDGTTRSERIRKIRWRTVYGNGRKYYDDIQVLASSKVNKKLFDKIEPFTLAKLHKYQPEFLSGFLAERYSKNVKDGWIEAQGDIRADLMNVVRGSIAADEVRNIVLNTNYKDVKYKHLLVPVWLSSYKYNDKIYQVMVNGENAKIVGNYPKSPWKIAFAVLGVLAVIAIILYFGGVFT